MKYQAYIGDPPQQMCFVDDVIEVDYLIKALGTRLKYCPDQKVGIIVSAKSARRILKALKDAKYYKEKAEKMQANVQALLDQINEERNENELETISQSSGTGHTRP